MNRLRAPLLATCLGLASLSLACDGGGPGMRVLATHVRAGENVVVRFDVAPVAPLRRGDVWLTLVPAGKDDSFVGERAVIEEGAAEATIPAAEEGLYELRLVDHSPRRLSRVVARFPVHVDRAGVARSEAPAWYW